MDELSIKEYLEKSKDEKSIPHDIVIECVDEVFPKLQIKKQSKRKKTEPELPEIIEVLKMIRLLKNQIEIFQVLDLQEEKRAVIKKALSEIIKVFLTYCEGQT